MEPQTNPGQYSNATLVGIGIGVVILSSTVGGIAGGMFAPSRKGAPLENQQAFSAPTNMILPTEDIRSISGTVTALSGNKMTIRPQGGTDISDMAVFVNKNTKVTRIAQKNESTAKSEMEEYAKKMEESKKTPRLVLPPEIIDQVSSTAEEISVGDFVFVTASQNLATKKEIIASELQFGPPISIGATIKK